MRRYLTPLPFHLRLYKVSTTLYGQSLQADAGIFQFATSGDGKMA